MSKSPNWTIGLVESEISINIATVCSPGTLESKKLCRVYIKEHRHDQGNLGTGKEYLTDSEPPAYLHVLDKDMLLVGYLNITGPRPTTASEVQEHKRTKVAKDGLSPFNEYREDIVNWANDWIPEEDGPGGFHCWAHARVQWKLDHFDPDPPF
jgi:hypothetical protein